MADNHRDEVLERAIADAQAEGVTLVAICKRAGIHTTTLWRWRQGIYSPVMREYRAVLAAAEYLENQGG